jgi:hypothetical protein
MPLKVSSGYDTNWIDLCSTEHKSIPGRPDDRLVGATPAGSLVAEKVYYAVNPNSRYNINQSLP